MANDNSYQRIIEIDDETIKALVIEKGELVETGRAISREMEALSEQFEKLKKELASQAGKVSAASHRIFKRVRKAVGNQLAEYEIPLTCQVRDGKLVLVVSDALSEFRDEFKKKDKFSAPKLSASK